jgi:hypothetical protein
MKSPSPVNKAEQFCYLTKSHFAPGDATPDPFSAHPEIFNDREMSSYCSVAYRRVFFEHRRASAEYRRV